MEHAVASRSAAGPPAMTRPETGRSGTQSLACRNFDHSRLVDARGAEKQLRCGSGWQWRLPSHSAGARPVPQSPALDRHADDGLNVPTRQLFRKVVDKRKSNVSHARLSFANISRTLKTAIVNIEIGP
jgi:hypothetical protein